MWRTDLIKVVVCNQDRQFLHFKCCCEGKTPFFLTAVYSIPNSSQKQILWNALEGFASSIVIPWVILGDFNDIAAASEKVGGSVSNDARFCQFTDRIRYCKLNDLGFCGSKFTWKGPIVGGRRIFERLDRALVNDAFLASFMNCVLKLSDVELHIVAKFPAMDQDVIARLASIPSDAEVKSALFAIRSLCWEF
ncbi:hypothetical protein K1719_011441 [Acacia pycnantha]|nr:hypothetical protein K1719_011441 [Acacia pycnantha]